MRLVDIPVRLEGAMTGSTKGDEPEDLISTAQLMKLLDDEPEPAHAGEHALDTVPLPKITRMPEGIEVTERRLGHAVGRWVLQVRCDCGRRWFEAEAIQAADCPRCGAVVLVDIEPP
jgi:hypothetical protein